MSETPVEELLDRVQCHLSRKKDAVLGMDTSRRKGVFSEAVYEGIEEAQAILSAIYVQPFLTAPRIPLVGRLWQRLRIAAHGLVVFYVNRLAGLQGAFNREVTVCLDALANDLDTGGRASLQNELKTLRSEVQALRAQIEALQPSISAPEGGQE